MCVNMHFLGNVWDTACFYEYNNVYLSAGYYVKEIKFKEITNNTKSRP